MIFDTFYNKMKAHYYSPNPNIIFMSDDDIEKYIFKVFRKGDLTLKIPVWVNLFFKKYDISEYKFEDVAWGIGNNLKMYKNIDIPKGFEEHLENIQKMYDNYMSEELKEYLKYNSVDLYYPASFQYTNANIDFFDSFEKKQLKCQIINNAEFKGKDLSNSHLTDIEKLIIHNCNFADTKIRINADTKLFLFNSDFTNCYFSNVEIDAICLVNVNTSSFIIECNLKNTKLKILYNDGMLSLDEKNKFIDFLKSGRANGCYLNDVLITSKTNIDELVSSNKMDISSLESLPIEETDEEIDLSILERLIEEADEKNDLFTLDSLIKKARKKIEILASQTNDDLLRFSSRFLDKLLFKTVELNDGRIVKYPIWNGPFLQKIDLSEVSFEDVTWQLLDEDYKNDKDYYMLYYPYFCEEEYEKICDECERPEYVDFSNTNAVIDFYKSFEGKHLSVIYVDKANFAGTFLGYDFPKKNIRYIDFHDCDLTDTHLDLKSMNSDSNLR